MCYPVDFVFDPIQLAGDTGSFSLARFVLSLEVVLPSAYDV
jgi:hypothetical protein